MLCGGSSNFKGSFTVPLKSHSLKAPFTDRFFLCDLFLSINCLILPMTLIYENKLCFN